MSRNTSRFDVSRTDDIVNRILHRNIHPDPRLPGRHTCCYNQNEDQFLLLEKPLEVPSFPVHHAMDDDHPSESYTEKVAAICENLAVQCPQLLAGCDWFFDPVNTHTPSFYRIARYGGQDYLYLLMIDLTCRPLENEIIEQGTNDRTHSYRTRRLYFESDFYPLSEPFIPGKPAVLDQTIPFTWRGESGQGYMLHGIWMDSDINKFFSKLILPAGKRNHPYYPVTCKQHCISMNAFGLEGPELLNRASACIEPYMDAILEDLQSAPFSEFMPLFRELKEGVCPDLGERWKDLNVKAYLNEYDQKEYSVEF